MTIPMEISWYSIDIDRKYCKVLKDFVWRKDGIGCRRPSETLAEALQSVNTVCLQTERL